METQAELDLSRTPDSLKGQAARMRDFFRSRPSSWIPLPVILALGVAQYNARILDCRKAGMSIENKTEVIEGVRHSWYFYDSKRSLTG